MMSHPVHIIDEDENLMPSSFIPFCSISSNMSLLGKSIPRFTYPVCTEFNPKIFEGQKCYELDLQNLQDSIPFSKGKEKGLTFALDYNEDRMINELLVENEIEATIYVDTLGLKHDFVLIFSL